MSTAERNRAAWTELAPAYAEHAAEAWAAEASWGVGSVPEERLGLLGDVAGLDAVELGCGTAYWCAWLARAGACPVGVDVTPAQLETAATLQRRFGLAFPLLEASAEAVPLPDGSFDLALSEYGASTWCDPARWLPEAARLLRPGGRLVFLAEAATETGPAERPDGSVVFRVADWRAPLEASGFEVERAVELGAESVWAARRR